MVTADEPLTSMACTVNGSVPSLASSSVASTTDLSRNFSDWKLALRRAPDGGDGERLRVRLASLGFLQFLQDLDRPEDFLDV